MSMFGSRLRIPILFTSCAFALSLSACQGDKGDKGDRGDNGTPGTAGAAAQPCTVTDGGSGTKTISCPDGTSVTVHDGAKGDNGAAGTSCTVTNNGNGSSTISCSDGTSTTVSNGRDGTNGTNGTNGSSCSVTDNHNGTKTIACTDGTSATVSDGTNGANGTNGADGSSCTARANPDGSKTISCSDGTSVTVSPPIGTVLAARQDSPGLAVHVISVSGASNADGTFAAGDHIAVTFSVATTTSVAIDLIDLDDARIWLSGPTTNYQHILPASATSSSYRDVISASTRNPDGTYTYAFADAIPANFGVPLFNTGKFTDGELSGPLTAGTYTIAMRLSKNYTSGATSFVDASTDMYDFLFDHATTLAPREVVKTDLCNSCHQTLQVHGGAIRDARLCVTCHTAGAEDRGSTDTNDATPVTIDYRVMIHKIHDGSHLPSVRGVSVNDDGSRKYNATPTPYVVAETDYSGVNFPVFPNFNISMPKDTGYSALASTQKTQEDNIRRGVTMCSKCHGDPDGTGPLTAPAQGNFFSMHPSRAACGSCHDDIDWTKPYTANGQTMPPMADDTSCAVCHPQRGSALSVADAHLHPLHNANVNPGLSTAITLAGGTGSNGNFAAGDRPVMTLAVTNDAGANVPLALLDSFSVAVLGPNQNRQVVFPYASPNGITQSPFDFSGRLAAPTTTNKGTMSKVFPTGTTTTEPLTVQFSSATAFAVSGLTSGSLGGASLAASPSTNPSGSSIANFNLTSSVVPGSYTLSFSSATAFSVVDGSSNTIGSGTLPSTVSGVTRFVSTDGSIAFNLTVGTTAFASGNSIYFTIFKGSAANPVVFAIVAGRGSFASGDRFYYDFWAPASSYTFHPPMDLPTEYLGTGDGSTVGQVFTAANTPVYYGRQTVWEQTALVGNATTLTTASGVLQRYVDLGLVDAGLATNDYVVIDSGNNTEYVQVAGIESTIRRVWFRTPLRFAHASGAGFQEATLTFRQEGTAYTLDPATGTITLAAASSNPWVMSYRTDGRFGWNRRAGDALQTTYAPPLNDTLTLGEPWGSWGGKPYASGTYVAAAWGYQNIEYPRNGETQTYRNSAAPGSVDFLYGTATTVTPYSVVENDGEKCQDCHVDLSFHGGGRASPKVCFLCHGVAGAGDNFSFPDNSPTGTINFRTYLHQLHEEGFPAMPGGNKNCSMCHGASTEWKDPADRNHPTAQNRQVRAFGVACLGCHTSRAAGAHIDSNTASDGDEACATCHGLNKDLEVSLMHKAR